VDAFHKRVRNAYLDMASEERFVVVDGSRDKDIVQKEIQNITAGRLL
jgi:thymidylate kinase